MSSHLRVRIHYALIVAAVVTTGTLAAVISPSPAQADTPAVTSAAGAVALLSADSDTDELPVLRRDSSGDVTAISVPAAAEVNNPTVTPATAPGAAADAAIARYGAALGATQAGTTLERAAVQPAVSGGNVVRYQQHVDGVPVVGGEVVVSLRENRELSSVLAHLSDQPELRAATVTEDAAVRAARDAFAKSAGAEVNDIQVTPAGRWLLDPDILDSNMPAGPLARARTVWRFELTRDADERRLLMVDDHTGAVLVNSNLITEALDRVVCDARNIPVEEEDACTSDFARTEGGTPAAVADVNFAYDLAKDVSDFYTAVGGIDITDMIGMAIGGTKRLAQTVRFCYDDAGLDCPYSNAFWNGTQMYYGQGYASADDVVGHELTHGFTEHTSNLFYWGQPGAINESISDIIGQIVDRRNGDADTRWALGEDLPGDYAVYGLRNMKDPTLFRDPDTTSSRWYRQESYYDWYDDNDGVHTNSGVGNKTFYLISQGGSFNGHRVTGIDTDSGLTKSGQLWLRADQSLTSGSDYADLAEVLDQSCQALLATPGSRFTSANCTAVHTATLATELRESPLNNPQPADAQAVCPAGYAKRSLFDSESGTATSKFVAGPTWRRDGIPYWGQIAHSGRDAWSSWVPNEAWASNLMLASGVPLPTGQPAYMYFQQWRMLEYDPDEGEFYDAGTVEVDSGSGPRDIANFPWVNGPADYIETDYGNPAGGRLGFGGDSRGYVASRVDLSSLAGRMVRPQFTLNTDESGYRVGWAIDDVEIYTCESVPITNTVPPSISGAPQVGATLTAAPGKWSPEGLTLTYQWLRDGTPIGGATMPTYFPTSIDLGSTLSVQVTGSAGPAAQVTVTSDPTAAVALGSLTAAKPTLRGVAAVGKTLTASSGTWTPSGVTLTYQWLRNGKPISSATRPTYKLTSADKSKRISVEVTGTKAGYATSSARSNPTAKVR